ncbi:hypothetical protein [Rhodococcoides yunnanense]|uniref:hypothetical protein n=1 Tax=Rhodococcoides yunnanense TaxID=278209 RepID=UPI001FE3FA8C|nr:hypothetical protein [Rhodococcus yunnanensis]
MASSERMIPRALSAELRWLLSSSCSYDELRLATTSNALAQFGFTAEVFTTGS